MISEFADENEDVCRETYGYDHFQLIKKVGETVELAETVQIYTLPNQTTTRHYGVE